MLATFPILPYTTYMTHEENKKELTPKMKQFCKEYVIDFNGQRAYLASYDSKSKKSASVQASKLLQVPKIKEYIDAYVQEQLGPLEKDLLGNVRFWIDTRDGRTPGLGKGPLVPLKKVLEILGDEESEEYKEVDSLPTYVVNPIRMGDRMKASEHLAKYRSMFIEKKEIDVSGKVQIIDDIK